VPIESIFILGSDTLESPYEDQVAIFQANGCNNKGCPGTGERGQSPRHGGVSPLTLKNVDRQSSEPLQASIPVRVLRFDLEHFETGGFSEDTHTLFISCSGASVALRNPVTAGDSLRIINLTNQSEADFRVVGALGTSEDGAGTWAIECQEQRDDFWGIAFPPPSAEVSENGVSLQCRACGTKANYPLTLMEHEVLSITGIIVLNCDSCGKPTYWVDAASKRPSGKFAATDAVAPPPRVRESKRKEGKEKRDDTRAAKRSGLKLPILVRNQAGEQEISKTVDVSKLGAGVNLFMKLEVGETVKISCPYDAQSGGIEQTAEVRWRSRYYNDDFPRTYGLRFIR
jgi:PilZ domain